MFKPAGSSHVGIVRHVTVEKWWNSRSSREREVGILELGPVPILGDGVACVDSCVEPGERPL